MDLKLNEDQKKRLTIELVILIVLIIVALLVYPSTRNYIFDIFNKSGTETSELTKEQQKIQDKTIAGVVDSISQNKIQLTTYMGSQGKKSWDVNLTDKTTYKKKSPGDVPQDAKFKDLAKGDNVVVTLTSKKTDKNLTASNVEKIIVEAQ